MRRIGISPELASWLLLLCGSPILLAFIPVANDSAWQIWLGRQMLHGANLYTDLIEVNPPLWFWIAIPLAWISENLALSGRIVLIGFALTSIAISLGLSSALIRNLPAKRRSLFLAAFLFVMVLVPLPVFTQREHFALISTIPYVVLASRRDAGGTVPRWLAIATGIFGALGFALKPFFALVPIALEFWLGRKVERLRPETVALGAMAVIYAGAVVVFERDFLASVPMISKAYRFFIGNNYNGFLIPLVLYALAWIPTRGAEGIARAFLIAGLTYLLAFLVQGKAWSYQALPALGMLVLAISALPLGRSPFRDGIALGIVLPIAILNARTYPTERPFVFPLHSRVATLSVTTQPNWPQVEERGYQWPLHAFSLWQLGAIEHGVLPAEPLQRRIAKDLRCNPPDYLLIDEIEPVRRFVTSSPELQEVVSHYRADVSRDRLLLYRRVSSLGPRPLDCRPVHAATAGP